MDLWLAVLALCITVVIGVALFALLGKDPVRGLQGLFWEPIARWYAWATDGQRPRRYC